MYGEDYYAPAYQRRTHFFRHGVSAYTHLVDSPGIEPGTQACKASVIPISPTAHVWSPRAGIEPPSTDYKTVILTVGRRGHMLER